MTLVIAPIKNYPQFMPIVAKWYMSFWGGRFPERTLADWENSIGANSDRLPLTLIAFYKNNPDIPVGTATLKLNGMGDYKSNQAWLSSLYVVPEYRGKKIATHLIEAVVNFANGKFSQLYLYTRTDGKIYIQLGWCVIEEKMIQGYSMKIMQKSLSPSIAKNPFCVISQSSCRSNDAKKSSPICSKL